MRRRELLALAGAAGLAPPVLRASEAAPRWSEALQREARQTLDGAAAEGLDPADYRDGPIEEAFEKAKTLQ